MNGLAYVVGGVVVVAVVLAVIKCVPAPPPKHRRPQDT